jgi:O-antigen/teichoic acid export membrane protein
VVEAHDQSDAPLHRLVLRGVGWGLSGQAVLQGSRFVVAVILARLLTPADFGLVAMALVFSGIATVVCDFGLGTALVARATLSQAERSTAFWISVSLGVTCSLIGLGLARPIADFYGEPRVAAIVAVLSAGFVISSLSATQSALLNREFRFRELEVASIVATLVGAAIGIGAAFHGLGAWAIVAQQLATGVASTILLWLFSPWRPSLTVSRIGLRELGGVGAQLSGTRILFYLHRNLDNLLVGRFLGTSALGVYSFAYNLILVPFGRIVDPVRGALLPALSRIQADRARVAELWLRVTRLLAAALMPAMLGLVAIAPDLVTVLLGGRWHRVTPIVEVLALVGLLQSVAGLNSIVLPVIGRTRTLLRFSVVTFVVSLGGFLAGLPFGVVGVACGYLAANVIVVPLYTCVTARELEISPLAPIRSLFGVVEASVGMFVIVVSARLLLRDVGVGAPLRLFLLTTLGTVAFIALCAWREREVLRELRRIRTPLRTAVIPSL